MKVLVVGCGAVGQVFSLCLQKAGVELGLYDQPAKVDRLRQALEHGGMPLFQITRARRRDPIAHRLDRYQAFADAAACRDFQPDQIWFTTPSPVYYSEWFHEFLRSVPSERVVCFAPEGGRPEFFPEGGEDRLVFGGTTFMAWQGDLEGGGGRPEGVNFWLPPLGIPLVGKKETCRDVAQLLNRAGFRVTVGKQNSRMQAAVTAVMTAFVAGLELSGWSLESYRKSPWLKRAAKAAREAALSQQPEAGLFARVFQRILLSSIGFHFFTLLLPLLFPFRLEKYLKFHYLKTREQTLVLLDTFARDGGRLALPVENIQALLQGLRGAA